MPLSTEISVYTSCMNLTMMSLYTFTKKCNLTIDEGAFLCNCFRLGVRTGMALHPLITLSFLGGTMSKEKLFMLPLPPLGLKVYMTLKEYVERRRKMCDKKNESERTQLKKSC